MSSTDNPGFFASRAAFKNRTKRPSSLSIASAIPADFKIVGIHPYTCAAARNSDRPTQPRDSSIAWAMQPFTRAGASVATGDRSRQQRAEQQV